MARHRNFQNVKLSAFGERDDDLDVYGQSVEEDTVLSPTTGTFDRFISFPFFFREIFRSLIFLEAQFMFRRNGREDNQNQLSDFMRIPAVAEEEDDAHDFPIEHTDQPVFPMDESTF